MPTAALITHMQPAEIRDAVDTTCELAAAASWGLVVTEDEVSKHGSSVEGFRVVDEMPAELDLCLVLGGDGSILYALRKFVGRGVPVFGVNFGTVGFLAAVERDELKPGVQRALAGDIEVIDLPGLEVRAEAGTAMGLNDVTFTRRPHGRVAELSYKIADEEVGNVRCDGLVVATPTGSTGYNLANNGPILAWGVEGYVVSYIAPHSLTARALVVAPDDVLHVVNAVDREPVELLVDGEPLGELPPGGEAEVGFRDRVGRLAQLPGASFYHRIREKFGHLAV